MDDYYVLGMTLGHNATAAITKNAQLIACASEERFVRKKNVYGYPKIAIEYCLKAAGIQSPHLSQVVLSSNITPPLQQTEEGLKEESPEQKNSSWFTVLSKARKTMSTVKEMEQVGYRTLAPLFAKTTHKKRVEIISSLLGVDPGKIISSEHHLTHAYSGIFSSDLLHNSPEDELLVVTVDGEGDGLSSSIGVFRCSDYNYRRIASSSYAESLGHFYSAVTSYLGMKALEHEYKVMGLAPYSYSDKAEALLKKLQTFLWVDDDLKIRTKIHSHRWQEVLEDLFRGSRFDHIATASQKLVETTVVELIKKAIQKTDLHSVILSGGVFMNVKANYEILKLPEVHQLFVMPSSGDESLPIGSCYYASLLHQKESLHHVKPLNHLYFGPAYSSEYIEKTLKENEFEYKDYGDRIGLYVAQLLSKGHIVARFSGRMEFGARSLGNRSILADASDIEVVQTINRMIKRRDFWMPFAPSIMEEHAAKYIKYPELLQKIKPYFMTMSFETTPLAEKDLKAAMHPADKTIRPQLVNKQTNPEYYNILHLYMQRTGKFGFLNTSFNIHGEPIVCTPDDALHTLRESGLEYVALGNFLVHKK